jgi:chromosome segregation ATPase
MAIMGNAQAMNDDLLTGAVNYGSWGGGFAGVLLAGRWLFTFVAGRSDRREQRLDAKEDAYRERMETRCATLEARCDTYEQEIETCHRQKRELETRITKLEGYDEGMGERRSDIQYLRTLADRIAKLERELKEGEQ